MKLSPELKQHISKYVATAVKYLYRAKSFLTSNPVKRTIGLLAVVVFLTASSVDPDSTVSPLALFGWGLIIIASLAIAGMALRQTQD